MPTGGCDDFPRRVSKELKDTFVKNVEPIELMDHLMCLEEIDEDVVKAQFKENGRTTAAEVLWDRLCGKPGWEKELINALRNPDIKLDFVAKKIEDVIATVPVSWDIGKFTDDSGTACFNGHCEETQLKVPQKEDTKMMKLKVPEGNEEMQISQTAAAREESLGEERERVRNKFFEKLISLIQTKDDVPVMLSHMKQFDLQFMGIKQGSILVNIYISSLEALDNLEHLWKYGGLKRMLDKEFLSKDMIRIFEETAMELNHPVRDIQSHVEVYDTDLLRCRTWLTRTHTDIRPGDFTFGAVQKKSKPDSREVMQAAKYVQDRLPEEIQDLLEDPFFTDRISSFYESKPLREKMKSSGDSSNKSVADLFIDWFDEEMCSYLKVIEKEGYYARDMFVVASFLVDKAKKGVHVEIPSKLPEDFLDVTLLKKGQSAKVRPKEEKSSPQKCFDLINILDNISFRTVCPKASQTLKEAAILIESKGSLVFNSNVLRDIFVTKIVMVDEEIDGQKFQDMSRHFDNLQTLVGIYGDYWKDRVAVKKWAEYEPWLFKTSLLRTVRASPVKLELKEGETQFVNEDLLLSKTVNIKFPENITGFLRHLDAVTVHDKRKMVTVDLTALTRSSGMSLWFVLSFINRNAFLLVKEHILSLSMKGILQPVHQEAVVFKCDTREGVASKPFSVETGEYTPGIKEAVKYTPVAGYALSLSADGLDLERINLEAIGLFLNVSPNVMSLSMKNCAITPDKFQSALLAGHFRNISHLQISNNPGLKKATQPLGLMYMSALESLEIKNCQLRDEGIMVLAKDLRHLKKLRELNVADNGMSSTGLLELSKGLSGRGLTNLRLQKNNLGRDESFVLASWLRELILLEVLNISECSIADKGAAVVARALVSTSLRKLSIRNNGFTTKGSQDFFHYFVRPASLEHIDFSENKMFTSLERSDVGPFLKFLQQKSSFSHLSFYKCGLGHRTLFQDTELYSVSFEQLTYLCLQENDLRDDFVRGLADCIRQHSQYLQHLNLRQNNIGNKGATALAYALGKQAFLKEVFLDRNVIGDEGAKELIRQCVSHEHFTLLDLSCNNISGVTLSQTTLDMEEKNKQLEAGHALSSTVLPKGLPDKTGHETDAFQVRRIDGKFVVVGGI